MATADRDRRRQLRDRWQVGNEPDETGPDLTELRPERVQTLADLADEPPRIERRKRHCIDCGMRLRDGSIYVGLRCRECYDEKHRIYRRRTR